MPVHPPWLRLQAYVVGLPKTGSTSMATIFGNYRSGHEWKLVELLGPALARRRGVIDDREFTEATGRRLIPASLEMDSATCHHLYTDFLLQRFPKAIFFHTIRDVLSWTTSLLDMVLRKRLAGRLIPVTYPAQVEDYFRFLTDGSCPSLPDDDSDDRASMVPLMRYWAMHMREMAALLPADRSLCVRVRDIGDRLPEIAEFAGVPLATLRHDLSHVNRARLKFDRFQAFNSPELRAAYDELCADIMADQFPQEHAAWMTRRAGNHPPQGDNGAWDRHRNQVLDLTADAVRRYGPRAAY